MEMRFNVYYELISKHHRSVFICSEDYVDTGISQLRFVLSAIIVESFSDHTTPQYI